MADRPPTPTLTLVIMGVSGSGKTTVMEALAERMDAATADGDAFHSAANIAKMRDGIPLSDDDRWPWLRAIARWIGEHERAHEDAIVACSALKRAYRDVLRDGHPSVRFVFLDLPREVLEERLKGRTGHYMKAAMLQSQLDALEPLEPDEPGFELDGDRPPPVLAAEILERVGRGGGPAEAPSPR
jgi:gluconokinase